jgi:hypothetical protein
LLNVGARSWIRPVDWACLRSTVTCRNAAGSTRVGGGEQVLEAGGFEEPEQVAGGVAGEAVEL